jgi:hypothetical protein
MSRLSWLAKRGQIRAVSVVALLLVFALFPPVAVESQSLNHAGLVIRHSDRRLIYAYIAFAEDEISGVELLRRSGISLVTVGFGGLGEGVCTIDGEGCPASDCRTRVCQGSGSDAPFWQYFRQRSPGNWQPLSLGASSTKVRDGDIDGWSWTPRDANIPPLTMDDLVHLAEVTTATDDAGGEPTPAVKTVFPPGHVGTADSDGAQDVATYLAGIGAVLVVGGAAVVAIRRRRQLDDAA